MLLPTAGLQFARRRVALRRVGAAEDAGTLLRGTHRRRWPETSRKRLFSAENVGENGLVGLIAFIFAECFCSCFFVRSMDDDNDALFVALGTSCCGGHTVSWSKIFGLKPFQAL